MGFMKNIDIYKQTVEEDTAARKEAKKFAEDFEDLVIKYLLAGFTEKDLLLDLKKKKVKTEAQLNHLIRLKRLRGVCAETIDELDYYFEMNDNKKVLSEIIETLKRVAVVAGAELK